MDTWQFIMCCRNDDTRIWTGWQWKHLKDESTQDSETEFATLLACKADAIENGYIPDVSSVSRLDGGAPMLAIFGCANLAEDFDNAAGLSAPRRC